MFSYIFYNKDPYQIQTCWYFKVFIDKFMFSSKIQFLSKYFAQIGKCSNYSPDNDHIFRHWIKLHKFPEILS